MSVGLLVLIFAVSMGGTIALGRPSAIVKFEPFRKITRPDQLPPGFVGSKAREQPRSPADVDTIVVHQTAIDGGFGLTGEQIKAAGNDPLAALERRYDDVSYQGIFSPRGSARTRRGVIPDKGLSFVLWPPWVYTWHGDGANRNSVGWAYDGHLPGDKLDVQGARQAFAHFVRAMRSAGAPLRYVESHAQHSDERGGDPGAEIWQEVIVPMLEPLDLTIRTRITGTGHVPEWLLAA